MAESGLEALARGLRGAGGVLNPEVQKMDEQSRRQDDAREDQRRNMLATLAIRGAEAGAIDPIVATKQLRDLGMDVPDGAIGPTPEAMARKQQYQNDVQFRDVVQKLGPNAPLSHVAAAATQFGKPELAIQLYAKHEDRIAQSEARRDALEERARQFDLQLASKDLDRATRERAQQASDETKRLAIAAQTSIAEMRQQLVDAKLSSEHDRALAGQTQKLSKDLEKAGLPEIDAVLGNAQKAPDTTPQAAAYLAGGGTLRPDWTLPKDIQAAKQAFAKLFNITLKSRSGSAVTNQELERLKQEFGAGVFKTPEQIRIAMGQAREIIQRHYAGIAAGYGKDVLEKYNSNLRDVGGSVVLNPSDKDEDPLGILK